MVFNIKMDDFRLNTRLAAGHMTEAPANDTDFSVTSRVKVRIALMVAAPNNLEVKLGDILKA